VTTAMSKHLQLPLGPIEAEAKAMEEAISFAWHIKVRDVIFETDCSTIYEALNRSTTPLFLLSTSLWMFSIDYRISDKIISNT